MDRMAKRSPPHGARKRTGSEETLDVLIEEARSERDLHQS